MSIPFSEDAVAQAFAERHAGTVRYVAEISTRHKWFILKDGAWVRDDTLLVQHLVSEICCEVSAEAVQAGLFSDAHRIASRSFSSGVEWLARCDRRLAATKADVGMVPKARARKAVRP
jgi:hypothetical protein